MLNRLLAKGVVRPLRILLGRRSRQFAIEPAEMPIISREFGAGPLSVYLADPVAIDWYGRGMDEPQEITELRKSRLKPGATVFDIGAHQAVIAMMLAREVGQTGKVIAVEAHPHNAHVGSLNVSLNAMPQITVINAAVSDKTGRATMTNDLNGIILDGREFPSWKSDWFEVNSMTIDGMIVRYGQPDVVFIDIEGAECLALRAAAKAFAKPADFFVEVHAGCGLEIVGNTPEEVFAFFDRSRFDVLVREVGEPEFRPFRTSDLALTSRFFLIAKSRA